MILFDVLTLAVIVWAIVRGWQSGFISQFLSFLGIMVGLFIAVHCGDGLGEMLGVSPEIASVVGFLIIFIFVIIISAILSKLLSKMISKVGLQWLNIALGCLFSILKCMVILSLFYSALYALNLRLRFTDAQNFDNSITFNPIRSMSKPVLDLWDAAAAPELEKANQNK
jgi:membrane protein required for colicin V production